MLCAQGWILSCLTDISDQNCLPRSGWRKNNNVALEKAVLFAHRVSLTCLMEFCRRRLPGKQWVFKEEISTPDVQGGAKIGGEERDKHSSPFETCFPWKPWPWWLLLCCDGVNKRLSPWLFSQTESQVGIAEWLPRLDSENPFRASFEIFTANLSKTCACV